MIGDPIPEPRETERPPTEPPKAGPPAVGQPAHVLALDVGNRRIGVALSNALGFAHPLLTVYRSTPRADVRSIARLVRRHTVEAVVVGDPLHLSGDLSRQAEKVRAFAAAVQQEVGPAVPVTMLDERLTSAEAHAQLDMVQGRRRSAADRTERAAKIDQVAAVLILEAFLQGSRPALLPEPAWE